MNAILDFVAVYRHANAVNDNHFAKATISYYMEALRPILLVQSIVIFYTNSEYQSIYDENGRFMSIRERNYQTADSVYSTKILQHQVGTLPQRVCNCTNEEFQSTKTVQPNPGPHNHFSTAEKQQPPKVIKIGTSKVSDWEAPEYVYLNNIPEYSKTAPAEKINGRSRDRYVDSEISIVPRINSQCFLTSKSFMCCNRQLHQLIEEASIKVRSKNVSKCNMHILVQLLQREAEKMFELKFEVVAVPSDFASKLHFIDNFMCKDEYDGRYILIYAAPQMKHS